MAKKQNITEDEAAQVILASTNDDPPLGQILEFMVSSALEHEKRKHLRAKLYDASGIALANATAPDSAY